MKLTAVRLIKTIMNTHKKRTYSDRTITDIPPPKPFKYQLISETSLDFTAGQVYESISTTPVTCDLTNVSPVPEDRFLFCTIQFCFLSILEIKKKPNK